MLKSQFIELTTPSNYHSLSHVASRLTVSVTAGVASGTPLAHFMVDLTIA
jgi:hypothetical protein